VGLYAFPVGPKIDPTLDHALLARTLDTIVGERTSTHSEFNLSASEVVDINAEMTSTGLRQTPPSRLASPTTALTSTDTPALQRVQLRECGGDPTPNNVSCVEQIMQEASSLGMYYEGQVMESLSQLTGMLGVLRRYPGRKTVVLLSAGMPTSDRPGGRPDVATAAMDIGRNAAEANSQIYAVHVDSGYLRAFSAETRKADKVPVDRSRDDSVGWRLLDQFAGASGGTLIRDLVGDGQIGFDQVLRETSAYYLLGVEPTDADRDGHTHELKVKVNAPNVTVRSRTWVSIPKK
jgi:VWFA-related protein